LKAFPSFAPTEPGEVDLLVIAGEASGDEHGSLLVEDLLSQRPQTRVCSLGGPCIESSGAFLLFNLVEHSVVGIFEVLRNYGFFRKLLEETLAWIERSKPKAVLLIDYPGFNLRLAAAMRQKGISAKGGGEIRVLQYVSPQLWAWKPKRRFEMEKTLDGLAAIFPFEPEHYRDVDLPVAFVGHPFARPDYAPPVRYEENGPLVLLPGSRVQPVERILPPFLDACENLVPQFPELEALVPVPDDKIRDLAEGLLKERDNLGGRVSIRGAKEGITARAALMSSGTMSLACALAGIPGAIAYRAHPITYFLGRMLVKVPHLGMANLLLPDDPPYEEFLQGRATGRNLAAAVSPFLESVSGHEPFRESARLILDCLSQPSARGLVEWLVQEGRLN